MSHSLSRCFWHIIEKICASQSRHRQKSCPRLTLFVSVHRSFFVLSKRKWPPSKNACDEVQAFPNVSASLCVSRRESSASRELHRKRRLSYLSPVCAHTRV